MHAVVSLLDEAAYGQVLALWRRLEAELSVGWLAQKVPFPHFSYHVAASYELDGLASQLADLAAITAAFPARATGIGIFAGQDPVVYWPVVKSPQLSRLHQTLWSQVDPLASGASPYYRPEQWLPHITLAQVDVDRENLGAIVAWLNQQEMPTELTVNNLALIYDQGGTQTIRLRFRLAEGR